jgi:hypothetical protein
MGVGLSLLTSRKSPCGGGSLDIFRYIPYFSHSSLGFVLVHHFAYRGAHIGAVTLLVI